LVHQEAGYDIRVKAIVYPAFTDEVGAGFGEMVIVTQGAPAMQAFNKGKPIPIDAVVVGIADNLELVDDAPVKKK
jgi:microcompartment protein CcmK/EutM